MASIAASSAVAPTLITVGLSIGQYLFEKALSFAGMSIEYGVVIADQTNTKLLIDSLSSNDTVLIDLDSEVQSAMDEDEKNMPALSHLVNSKAAYKKAEELKVELKDVMQGIENGKKKFIFISSDYHLLKYADVASITYTLPSDAYYRQLKDANPNFDDVTYQKIKQEMQTKKATKILVYNSFNDLQTLFINKFGFQLKA